MLIVWYSQCALRVWYSHAKSIIVQHECYSQFTLRVWCWEYDTLSACWWYSQCAPQRAVLRVSYSQHRTLRHTLRVSVWAESIRLSASYFQPALRVSLTLRVWYSLSFFVTIIPSRSHSVAVFIVNQPTDQQPTNDRWLATEELKYSRNRVWRHWCPTNNMFEVWQTSAPFGGRPIGGAVEALLPKVVNW